MRGKPTEDLGGTGVFLMVAVLLTGGPRVLGDVVGGVDRAAQPPERIDSDLVPRAPQPTERLIDFDNVAAPDLFMLTVRLTERYVDLGVHFVGPGGRDGGAIIDQAGNFGVNALSGRNFLAFNRTAELSDGGVPRGPETIRFDELMAGVSIYAAGGDGAGTFVLDAYDTAGALVDSDGVRTSAWELLEVSWAPGIGKVVLTETSGDEYFVYDNLLFQPVPEPAALLLICGAAAPVLLKRRRS